MTNSTETRMPRCGQAQQAAFRVPGGRDGLREPLRAGAPERENVREVPGAARPRGAHEPGHRRGSAGIGRVTINGRTAAGQRRVLKQRATPGSRCGGAGCELALFVRIQFDPKAL